MCLPITKSMPFTENDDVVRSGVTFTIGLDLLVGYQLNLNMLIMLCIVQTSTVMCH